MTMTNTTYSKIILMVSCLLTAPNLLAQSDSTVLGLPTRADTAPTENQQIKAQQLAKQAEAVLQLQEMETSLSVKKALLSSLQKDLKRAPENGRAQIQSKIAEVENEIQLIDRTFEQIAIGGVDLSAFGVEEEVFDWREELVLIIKPLIENIKGLTEKPRKMENLRQLIQNKAKGLKTANDAQQSIAALAEKSTGNGVLSKLESLRADWQRKAEDLEREIQLAKFQLENLEGKNTPWLEVLGTGTVNFVSGRGLTLLLSIFAAVSVWMLMRGLLWIVRKRAREVEEHGPRTYYRLAAYAYRLLTVVLIAVAVMMVFYMRQDLLLLAITAVILFGAALALNRVLPTYITEGRILLNIGAVRERERVIYAGIPWQVDSINMFSSLVNPEIRGSIKIPIGQMHDMISRPNLGEPWFVSSEGDWVINENGDPMQVISQSVDMVLLQDLDSVTSAIPTAEYFQKGYANLSRTNIFRIAVLFGIDYSTQNIDMDLIEERFARGVKDTLDKAPYAEFLEHVGCDFHSAGDSSLNYIMLTRFNSDAAPHYNRIKRQIQRACVAVCSENGWPIPFPQMSVHVSEVGEH